jgi:hypothetical protein
VEALEVGGAGDHFRHYSPPKALLPLKRYGSEALLGWPKIVLKRNQMLWLKISTVKSKGNPWNILN